MGELGQGVKFLIFLMIALPKALHANPDTGPDGNRRAPRQTGGGVYPATLSLRAAGAPFENTRADGL